MSLKVKLVHPDAKVPTQANPSDAGYDLVAVDDGVISPEGYIEYDTGLQIEPPPGYHTEIVPRSSISKYDLILANSIGVVDNPYRGNIKVRFKRVETCHTHVSSCNSIFDTFKVYQKGDRIAQLIVRKTEHLNIREVDELSDTTRGSGGFGSTGV